MLAGQNTLLVAATAVIAVAVAARITRRLLVRAAHFLVVAHRLGVLGFGALDRSNRGETARCRRSGISFGTIGRIIRGGTVLIRRQTGVGLRTGFDRYLNLLGLGPALFFRAALFLFMSALTFFLFAAIRLFHGGKAGLFGLTKTLAREAAFQLGRAEKLTDDTIGVTINAVTPGYVLTEMVQAVPEKVLDKIKLNIPLRRLAQPEEIARVVHFLVADESSFITGQVWGVNGGQDM